MGGIVVDLADPERALAVAYAPRDLQPGLTALFALDERLGGIVASTTEPMIGLMRLAWWRESIEKLGTAPAPAEPLLGALAGVSAHGVSPTSIAECEDGWAALLDGDLDAETIARHGRKRGGQLFLSAARLLGAPEEGMEAAGTGWALADLGHRHSDPQIRAEARAQARAALAALGGRRWPKSALPLAVLALLATRDAKDGGVRRQGAPNRLFRLLALRLFRR